MTQTLDAVYSCISNVSATGILLGTSFLAFVLYRLVHRLLVSPLSKIPGPLSLKATSIFNKYYELRGQKREWLHELHSRYGEVVTIGPNEVSFASETGLKQIYSSGSKDFLKTELYDLFRQAGQINLFTAIDPHQHASIRKPLADRYSNTNILKSKILDSISERSEAFAELASRRASIDVYLFLHAYALDCVTSMLFHPYGTNSLSGTGDKEMVELLSYDDSRIGISKGK
ncbi:benzoate 4-monooxygenase cytochrome p450 [Penicillium cataractarum]|uniref:Benzoate 4-monooxygenase cytochrome p450 n=1 Tax=Penicillium cataractarum TaxID=2100454 RepID=A0A9W9V6F7_9EURO|nr:benzoate 4-monooxygenase cytochrome p450 [Penicillium cataractarum]KAJ5368155.1 benzoate 4-monooxygenase cytochrome p450 [Penicillium cataractarum]